MNEFKTDFCDALFRTIAKESGSKQALVDVGFVARNVFAGKGGKYLHRLYIEHTEDAFIIASLNKNGFRIIGMATRGRAKGKGLATTLLNRAETFARQCGYHLMWTRSIDGKDFYIHRGFAVIGMRGKDFI